mmetsp:Transcript_21836/g.37295  ORF Transcript_21836/g.37295 Transcript_21836/m.37295 type:complete len:147 (+) Transcript_21836:78-518(+)|eukprot:CAMPEP_0119101554 /NCGR_PEP_ID=MMETSP1180-20130426/586_1 /TAXON_ID=3052 ORGANISM="Chlamydomonas cf sp, Strain CCMP681" /NCGR_SAMPLE_ID=MMETSP1180 /ASSEMBLY_ACC=CAM_ASM_000741 /LENGTH=146 /DNA_ID=CAMNT_0007085695 /DNA_START=79 /DNA_END=519 /DNA_ORIENTATION=-
MSVQTSSVASLLPVTGVTAGYFGVVTAVLAMRVGLNRLNTTTFYGLPKAEKKEVDAHVHKERAHGNTVEWTSPFLFVLASLELNKVLPTKQLAIIAGIFTLARTSHTLHLARPSLPVIFRLAGFLTQAAVLAGAGAVLLYTGLKNL